MPNRTETPRQVVDRISTALERDQRSVAWLARTAGVPDSTLRFQLKRPDRLTVETWLRCADALGFTREELVA